MNADELNGGMLTVGCIRRVKGVCYADEGKRVQPVAMDFENESRGIRKLFELAGAILIIFSCVLFLKSPFWTQKGVFKAQKQPDFGMLINYYSYLLRSDPERPRTEGRTKAMIVDEFVDSV